MREWCLDGMGGCSTVQHLCLEVAAVVLIVSLLVVFGPHLPRGLQATE